MRILLLLLALTIPAWSESAPLAPVDSSALHGKAHRGAHVYRFASMLLEIYPKRNQALLEVHRLDGARLAREVVPKKWLEGSLEIGLLDEKAPGLGFALWVEQANLELLVLRGKELHSNWKREQHGEFSTTGWSSLSVGHGKDGRMQIIRSHESPGEETAEGRKIDVWNEIQEWNPATGDFVALPNR